MPASVVRTRVAGEAYEVRSQLRPDGTLLFEVRLRRGLSDGRYSSVLELGHADDPAAISIPLDAEVGPAVSLVPSTVRMARDEESGSYRPTQVMALARRPGLLLGPLRAVDWPEGVRLEERSARPTRMRRFTVLVDRGVSLPEGGVELGLVAPDVQERLVLKLTPAASRARTSERVSADAPPGSQNEEN